jgi:hypothetical protein
MARPAIWLFTLALVADAILVNESIQNRGVLMELG